MKKILKYHMDDPHDNTASASASASASVPIITTPCASPTSTAISSGNIAHYNNNKSIINDDDNDDIFGTSNIFGTTAKRPLSIFCTDNVSASTIEEYSDSMQVGANISSRGVSRGFVLLVLLRMNGEVRSLREEGDREDKIQINSFSDYTVKEWFTEAMKDLLSDPSFEDAFCGSRYEKGQGGGQYSTRFDPRDTTTYWTHTNQLVSWWKNNVERRSKFNVLVRDASYEGFETVKLRRKIFCEVAIKICSNTRGFFDRVKKKTRVGSDAVESAPQYAVASSFPIDLPIRLPQRLASSGFTGSPSAPCSASIPCIMEPDDIHFTPINSSYGQGSNSNNGFNRSTSVASIDTVTTRETSSRTSYQSGRYMNEGKYQNRASESGYSLADYSDNTCSAKCGSNGGGAAFGDHTFRDGAFERVAASYCGVDFERCEWLESSVGSQSDELFSGIDFSHHDRRPVTVKSLSSSCLTTFTNTNSNSYQYKVHPTTPTKKSASTPSFLTDAIQAMTNVSDCDSMSMECSISSGFDSENISNASTVVVGDKEQGSSDEFDYILRTKFSDCSFKPITFDMVGSSNDVGHNDFDMGSMSLIDGSRCDYDDFFVDWGVGSGVDWSTVDSSNG